MSTTPVDDWDTNEFYLSLASLLLGADTVHQHLTRAIQQDQVSLFRLYWRTPLQHVQLDPRTLQAGTITTTDCGSDDHHQEQPQQQQPAIVWMDMTWTFSCQGDIQWQVGSLIMHPRPAPASAVDNTYHPNHLTTGSSIGTTAAAATYRQSPPLDQHHWERHFGALSIELHPETPVVVLAQTVATALLQPQPTISCHHCHATTSRTMELYYDDFGLSAPLLEPDDPVSVSDMDATLLDLLMRNCLSTTNSTATLYDSQQQLPSRPASISPVDHEKLMSFFRQWQQLAATNTGPDAGLLTQKEEPSSNQTFASPALSQTTASYQLSSPSHQTNSRLPALAAATNRSPQQQQQQQQESSGSTMTGSTAPVALEKRTIKRTHAAMTRKKPTKLRFKNNA